MVPPHNSQRGDTRDVVFECDCICICMLRDLDIPAGRMRRSMHTEPGGREQLLHAFTRVKHARFHGACGRPDDLGNLVD